MFQSYGYCLIWILAFIHEMLKKQITVTDRSSSYMRGPVANNMNIKRVMLCVEGHEGKVVCKWPDLSQAVREFATELHINHVLQLPESLIRQQLVHSQHVSSLDRLRHFISSIWQVVVW